MLWSQSKCPVTMLGAERHRVGHRKLRLWLCACMWYISHPTVVEARNYALRKADGGLPRAPEISQAYLAEYLVRPNCDMVEAALEYAQTKKGWGPDNADLLREVYKPGLPHLVAQHYLCGACSSPNRYVDNDVATCEDCGSTRNWKRRLDDWLGDEALALARAAYDNVSLPRCSLDNDRLGVLADALEERGCDDEPLLAHLRAPQLHVRGCWALDVVLGKK